MTGEVDLAVGSVVAGRNRAEIEGLVGFFVNTLVLRADLSGWQGQTTPVVGRTTSRPFEVPQSSGVAKFALVCPGKEQGQGVSVAEGSGISGHHHRPDELAHALPLPPFDKGEPTFCELLGRVRETALGAYAHQDVPFESLVEALEPERNLSQNPLAQVLFLLQNAPAGAADFGPELEAAIEGVATGEAKFHLTLGLVEGEEGLRGGLEYNVDLFDRTTIHRLLGSWRRLLEAVVSDPERCLFELPLISEAERQQLVREWNDTHSSRTDPPEVTLHQLIEAQVEKTPEAVAVEFAGERLSYRELNRRANQLAHHLRSLGARRKAGPAEVRVGICAERSSELVVGLLGILKAGGAYLPLDPSYPPERLSFMAEASEVGVLLTQERLLPALPALADRAV
ncbi:MAG: AMP-binding protein, partial [bacterium]|nr:AMP-binding protein [bacterium]